MSNTIGSVLQVAELATDPANPTAGFRSHYAKSTGFFMKTSGGVVRELRNPVNIVTLAADFTTTNNIRSNITGWTYPVVAGKIYRFEVVGTATSTVTNNGVSLGVFLATGAGTIRGSMKGSTTSIAAGTDLSIPIYAVNNINVTPGSSLTTTSVNATATPHFLILDSVFTCTTSGTFSIQFGSETPVTSVSFQAGSVFIITELLF